MTHEADKKPRSWDFEKTVFDEKGLQYKLESKEIGHLIQVELSRKLWDTERLVGVCRLIQSAEEMRLSDIKIKNYPNENNILFKLLHPFEPSNYRSRRVGTAILKEAIDLAKRKGMKRLCGIVVREDTDENTHLVQWYENNGFAIEAPTPQDLNKLSNAVHRVCLYLT